MKYLKLYQLLTISLLVVFSGCASSTSNAPTFYVNVDTIGQQNGKINYVLAINPLMKVSIDSLEYKEYTPYIHRALKQKGFIFSDNPDVLIMVAYGIGKPNKHSKSYSKPLYGVVGTSSKTTYSNSNTYASLNSYGNNANYNGNTNTDKTTYYKPQYGVVGYKNGVHKYTTYKRNIILTALDYKAFKANKVVKLWVTTISSEGSSDDLRQVFPVMLGAAKWYLGTNTGKKIKVSLLEDDKSVLEVKGIKIKK